MFKAFQILLMREQVFNMIHCHLIPGF